MGLTQLDRSVSPGQGTRVPVTLNQNDSTLVKSGDPSVIELFGGSQASSGYRINKESAMRVAAVSACVQLLGGTISTLPLTVYKNTDSGREKIKPRIWSLLNNRPCPAWTAAGMIQWWICSIAFRGDSFSRIVRDRRGVVSKIIPLNPDRVRVNIIEDDGDISYAYQPKDGDAIGIHADDMLHIPGFSYDGSVGRSKSIIQQGAMQSIGIALAADDFSGSFFHNNGMPKYAISSETKISEELGEKLKQEFIRRYGGAKNSGLPMILQEGLQFKELSMSSVDAELLDSRKYQVIDIARAFGVPPFMIGANDTTTSWGSGIEQMTLGFVKFTLQAYLVRIEQEINSKLFSGQDSFAEFNLQGLLKGDSQSEAKFLREMRGGSQGPGIMTIDEIRAVKNLPLLGQENGGNEIYIPEGKDNDSEKDGEQPDEAFTDDSGQ